MDIFSNPVLAQIVSIAVAAVCGWLGATLTRLRKREDALYAGMRSILRRELVDDYRRHITEQEPISIERKQEIDDCYTAYEALGGNGTGAQMYEELRKVKVTIIGKD